MVLRKDFNHESHEKHEILKTCVNAVIAREHKRPRQSQGDCDMLGDYKLHPCNLPFGSHKVRSILLRAKLVPRCARNDA